MPNAGTFICLSCFLLTLRFSWALNCTLFGLHVSLGSYYQHFGPNSTHSLTKFTSTEMQMYIEPFVNRTLFVQFETIDNCSDIRLACFDNNSQIVVVETEPSISQFEFTQSDLKANQTRYFYNLTLELNQTQFQQPFNFSIVNKTEENAYSIVRNVTSRLPLRDSDNNSTQTFIFVGRMDNSAKSKTTFSRLNSLASSARSNQSSADLVIYLGDMAFSMADNNYAQGDSFVVALENFSETLPLVTTPGVQFSEDDFKVYNYMFRTTSDQKHGVFYSFNLGYVHFIQINTAYFFSKAHLKNQSVLLGYLSDDLTEAAKTENRYVRPWIFVFADNSFTCGMLEDTVCSELIANQYFQNMETLLHKYQVDLFFSANASIYLRSKPTYQSETADFSLINVTDSSQTEVLSIYNPLGVVYIVEGTGGYSPYTSSYTLAKNFIFGSSNVSYGSLTVINKTYLYFEQIDSETGKPIDRFFIINELRKWEQQWTAEQEYLFVVCSIVFVFLGIIFIGIFQIYVDAVM